MKDQVLKTMKCFGLTLLMSLVAPQAVLAATTTLTFDELADGTALTNQYQSLGVTISGILVVDAALSGSPWPPTSGLNVAFSTPGIMSFNFNSTITGNIQTVSAFVSTAVPVGLYAFDVNGILVGQSLLAPGGAPNTLLSVTTTGNPIVNVSIYDSGGAFAIDDFTFVSAVAAPSCPQVAQNLYDGVTALIPSDFRFPRSKALIRQARLKKEVAEFQQLLSTNSSPAQLLYQLGEIKSRIREWLKIGPTRTELINQIDQLIVMVNAGQC